MRSFRNDDRARRVRNLVLGGFVVVALFNWLLHIPAFYRTTFHADETVFLALSRAMNWDTTHYNVMDHPAYSTLPCSIYRQPLYHHGPVLPYVLKVGNVFHATIQTAMFFQCVVMSLFFLHLHELQLRLKVAPAWWLVAFIGAAICPFILFSTTRLHHDAAAGLLIGCGLVALVEGLERRSVCWTIWSGLLLSLALNTHYSSILVLPLVVIFQIYGACKPTDSAAPRWRDNKWFHFLLLWLILLTIGLVHFYRLFLTYGTIDLGKIVVPDPTNPSNVLLSASSRWRSIVNLILTMPALLVFVIPETYRVATRGRKDSSWGPAFLVACLTVFFILLWRSSEGLRVYAFATPLFFLCLAWLIANARPLYARINVALCVLSLVPMAFDAYRETMLRIDEDVKSDSPLIAFLSFLGV